MEFKVRFRFNKTTGEVEVFEVDNVGPMRLPEAEHNRQHDRVAADLGNVVERNPRVDEILPGSPVFTEETHVRAPEPENEVRSGKEKGRTEK